MSKRTAGEELSFLKGMLGVLVETLQAIDDSKSRLCDAVNVSADAVREELDRIPGLELAIKEMQLVRTAEPLREAWTVGDYQWRPDAAKASRDQKVADDARIGAEMLRWVEANRDREGKRREDRDTAGNHPSAQVIEDGINRGEPIPACFFCRKEVAMKEACFSIPKQGNIRVCRECRLIVGLKL